MNQFQLLFRGSNGDSDQTEFRYNADDGEPKIDGRLIVDGETYTIRCVDWLIKKDGEPSDMPRFVCTLVVEPVAE